MAWVNALSANDCRDFAYVAARMNPRLLRSYVMGMLDCRLRGRIGSEGRGLQEALLAGPKYLRETVLPRLGEHGFELLDGGLSHPDVDSVAGTESRLSAAGRTAARARHARSQLTLVSNEKDDADEPRSSTDTPLSHDGDRRQTAAESHVSKDANDLRSAVESQPKIDADRMSIAAESQAGTAPALARPDSLSPTDSSLQFSGESPCEREEERGSGGKPSAASDARSGAAIGLRTAAESQPEIDANRTPIAAESQADRSSIAADRTSPKSGEPRPHPLPADWQPGEQSRQYAQEHGVDAETNLIELRDWAAAKGRRSLDWEAEYRNFVRQAEGRRRQAPLPPMGMPQSAPAAVPVAEGDRLLADRLNRLWTAWSRDKAPPMPTSLETYKAGLATAESIATRWLAALEGWDHAGRPSRIRVPDFQRTISDRDAGELLAAIEDEIAAVAQQQRRA